MGGSREKIRCEDRLRKQSPFPASQTPNKNTPSRGVFVWCLGPESNRYAALRRRRILSPLCLPISPPRPTRNYKGGIGSVCRPISRWQERWRRVPESNRRLRICNPLHSHFANPPKWPDIDQAVWNSLNDSGKACTFPGLFWSGKRVSNSRPQPWQGCALPTELFPQWVAL